jgi:hypothetical protein
MTTRTFVGAGTASVLTVLAGLCSSGCAEDSGAFRPLINSGRAGATHAATTYRVKIGAEDVGKATVWTEGQPKPHLIDVGMRVQNEASAPIEVDVDGSDLRVSTRRVGTVLLTTASQVGGDARVPPNAAGTVKLAYALPANVSPQDVMGYQFEWRLRTPRGDYEQSTPFVRAQVTEYGGTCPDLYGVLGYCSGWFQGDQWMGFDNPSDPTMPASPGTGRTPR